MIRDVVAWGPAAIWAAVLFLLSAAADLPGTPWLPWSDELAHFGLYGVLGATLARGRVRGRGEPGHGTLIVLGLLYALSDEGHQALVPGRDPSAGDFLADALGLLVGYVVSFLLLARHGEGGMAPPSARAADPGAGTHA